MARGPKPATEEREGSKRLNALLSLWPFLRPYKALLFAAIGALVLTAVVSLVLPLAVRRVVDNFNLGGGDLVNRYFGAALAVTALLALGTAVRYYLVTRL